MKIKELIIYGFGKFTNLQLCSIHAFQVIYGENEAGKSTIMAFIHAILFGFPTKQQSELRYEPKNYIKYGGKLIIETKNHGEVTIERLQGKAAGDVTVTLENGIVGHEELLQEIVIGVDKRMYHSIFSFNIHGLQGIGRMRGEDISQYLLAAGTFGTDTIVKAEQQLQKELDAMFKPNGRKPELNQLLDHVKEKDEELKKEKKQNASYNLLQQRAGALQKEIEQLHNQLQMNQNKVYELDSRIQEWPLYQEREQIQNRMQELGKITFPIDGLNRLEHLEDQLRSVSSYLTTIQERKVLIENQMKTAVPNPSVIENEIKIQLVVEQWPQAQEWYEQLQKLRFEIEKIDDQIKKLQQDLHYAQEDMNHISHLDIGIGMKENIRKATKNFFYLTSREKELLKQEETEKQILENIELEIDRLEESLMTEDEFRSLTENQKQYKSIQQSQLEHQQIQEKIQMIKMANGGEQTKVARIRTIVMIFLLIALMIFSFLSKQFLLFGGTCLGCIFLNIAYWAERKKGRSHSIDFLSLLEKEKQLSEQLHDQHRFSDQSELYEAQQELRQEWKEIILQLEAQQIRYEGVKQAIKLLYKEWKENDEHLSSIKKQLRLSTISSEQLMEAFELLNELSKVLKEKEAKHKNHEALKMKYHDWSSQVEKLTLLVSEQKLPINDSIMILKNEWKKTQDKQNAYEGFKAKLDELNQEELKWSNDREALNNAIADLLKEAEAKNKEEFRQISKRYDEFHKLKLKLDIMEKKLKDVSFTQTVKSISTLEEERLELLENIQLYTSMLENLHKELAEVTYEIKVLEEGGTYTEKLHEFYYQKDMLNGKAKKWARISIARQILKITMDRLNNERFPKVMEKAEEYLRVLTNDEYKRIHIQEDGKFVVERKDHMIFMPAELSQATAEQLYVAIRFSLVYVLKQEYSFPIIIDDSFVNFDKNRTSRVIELLKEISETTQVLFFTCHQHLLPLFPKKDIMELSEANATQKVEVIG